MVQPLLNTSCVFSVLFTPNHIPFKYRCPNCCYVWCRHFYLTNGHFTHETGSLWPFTSSTLIGVKGGAGPSPLHTTLEGPMEYVTARWMYSLHGFLSDIPWIMFHGHLDYFQKPPLGGRPNTKPGDHGTWKLTIVDLFYSIMCEDPHE